MEIGRDRSSKLGDQRSMKSLMPVVARLCPASPSACASAGQIARSGRDAANLLIGGLVKAAQPRARDELVGLAPHRLPRAEHEEALRYCHRAQAGKGILAHRLRHIEKQLARSEERRSRQE